MAAVAMLDQQAAAAAAEIFKITTFQSAKDAKNERHNLFVPVVAINGIAAEVVR